MGCGAQDVARGCARRHYLPDVLDVRKCGVDGRPCAGAKCVSNPASLITSEVDAVGPERKSDIRVEIVRLHGEQVLACHGDEVDRSNHDLYPSAPWFPSTPHYDLRRVLPNRVWTARVRRSIRPSHVQIPDSHGSIQQAATHLKGVRGDRSTPRLDSSGRTRGTTWSRSSRGGRGRHELRGNTLRIINKQRHRG
jgi:hypothetical protein